MDIYKALKLEKKYEKIYYSIMFLLAIILPVAVLFFGLETAFFLICLLVLEMLILLAIINRIDSMKLKFSCLNNKLRINTGIFGKESLILCNRVALVHTVNMEQEMEIIIITSMSFKNRRLRLVTDPFLKRYSSIKEEYERLKMTNPDTIYYFQVIRKGGLKKYMLLDTIYKNCVKSVFTDDGIQNIKIARGQTLV